MPTATGILALIKDRDATNADPVKDRMCYKAGDFVQLFPPGTPYNVPCAEPFYLLDVTGVPITYEEVVARYMQPVPDDGQGQRRRMYYVDLSKLPRANEQDLAAQRVTVIAWNRLRSAVTNKVTGQPEG